jgi:hypothetical protein
MSLWPGGVRASHQVTRSVSPSAPLTVEFQPIEKGRCVCVTFGIGSLHIDRVDHGCRLFAVPEGDEGSARPEGLKAK